MREQQAGGKRGSATFRLKLIGDSLGLMWKHCDIASDFLGKFHAERSASLGIDSNEMKHNISYMANEVLENAVKFGSSGNIELQTTLGGQQFQLRIWNNLTAEAATRFQGVIAELEGGDPSTMLIERIEANAANPDLGVSGLGLLTLMSDYGVQFDWKFDNSNGGRSIVLETHASLPLD